MKKILLISLLTINSPILSMLRTQQVGTLLLRNSTAITRSMSTSQPPEQPCMTQEIKNDNLTKAITVWSATATGIGIGTILGTMQRKKAEKELMSETEKPKENNNDSDRD